MQNEVWYVLRLNDSLDDTYAAETLEDACNLAMFDEVHHTTTPAVHGCVLAPDAGAARLMTPPEWYDTRETLRNSNLLRAERSNPRNV